MAIREIHLDAEADRILESMSQLYGEDTDRAVSDLLKTRDSLESMVGEIESHNAAELLRQRDRSRQQFESGQTISWDDIKRRNGS